MFAFIGKWFQSFQHVEHTAVAALLPFVEKDIGVFVTNALPVAEDLVIGLIKNKGVISTADRDAAAAQIKVGIASSVHQIAVDAGTGAKVVQVTDGVAKWLLDTAYQKLKFTGAIVPSGATVNVGIAATTV